jgi:hypothetical protein
VEVVLTKIKMINKNKFSKNSKIYAFTTENLKGYYDYLPLRNSKVLTVGGSGDQIINSYLYGASDVTAFDINICAKYYSDLKLTAVNNLSFEEFKKFFMRDKFNTVLEYNVYKKLKENLHKTSSDFFNLKYNTYNYNGEELRESNLFNNNYDYEKLKIFSNEYLQSEEKYNEAQERMKNKKFKWIQTSVENITSKLNESYDLIMLSNISDYANLIYENNNYLENYY